MHKGGIQTSGEFQLSLLKGFIRRFPVWECKYSKYYTPEKYYERILRRIVAPKILKEKGILLWDIASVKDVYNLWNETQKKSEKAALGHYLEYIKERNDIEKWSLTYATHKKIWSLKAPQILYYFRRRLESVVYPTDPSAVDACMEKLIHIADIEQLTIPELVRKIKTVIIYYIDGDYREVILNFYDFINRYKKPSTSDTISPDKKLMNILAVKKNLNKWYHNLSCPYIKIISLYYEYCNSHNSTPPNRHQLEEVCLQANMSKAVVRTYLCYFCKPGTQTGQIFLEKLKGRPLEILPELRQIMDGFYKRIQKTKALTYKYAE